MDNPYSPTKNADGLDTGRIVSTINGAIIGLGIGLLTCDFIDLNPSDYTALYGWRNGLVIFGVLGTVLGSIRNDSLAWRWIVLLGTMHLFLGLTLAGTTFSGLPLNLYTTTMISAGVIYLSFGATVGVCTSSGLRRTM